MAGGTRPLDRGGVHAVGSEHPSLGQRVADELRRAILERRYAPGQRLIEESLSLELGVSRVPVREALRVLASEGLVAMQARRGASVADVSGALARDLVEVRATLEGLNARLAARHREPAIVDELREILDQGNRAARRKDVAALIRLNADFHDKLAAAGGNAILGGIMRSLRERTSLVFAANGAARARQDWLEHAEILAAVISGDEQAAALCAQHHVHRAADAAFTARAAGEAVAAPAGRSNATRRVSAVRRRS